MISCWPRPPEACAFPDYLPTRTLELIVHTLDLARAVELRARPPAQPLSTTLALLANLALLQGEGPDVALALTGRGPLPPGFSVMK